MADKPTPAERLSDDDFKKYFPEWMLSELHNEGFPNWMIYSFVSTAKETKSIVLSRTPGGVGLDLINASYDLKGFQIKAKSCNWGPMAGFICQLPFLNKAGHKKITYNTGYILHYLESLAKFKNVTPQIDAINKDLVNALTYLDTIAAGDLPAKANDIGGTLVAKFKSDDSVYDFSAVFPADKVHKSLISGKPLNEIQKDAKNIITTEFNKQIGTLVKQYREAEETSGKWSGENTIEGDSPFIHLKRAFGKDSAEAVANLTKIKTIVTDSIVSIGSDVYCIANDEGRSIYIELLLRKESDNVWAIFHGEIAYTDAKGALQKYVPSVVNNIPAYWNILEPKFKEDHPIIPPKDANEETKLRCVDNRRFFDQIFSFASAGVPLSINVAKGRNIPPDGSSINFANGRKDFFPLQGFVNPHPPYKKRLPNPDKSLGTLVDNPWYYKNAVSGDYDLFAFWPKHDFPASSIMRLSEDLLDTDLKLYVRRTLSVEFIPGFDELAPSAEAEFSKESAELGNISTLGATVAGTINSFSNVFLAPLLKKLVLNKAFHSDEGGRPGVMEIEFPIAVFFHTSVKSKALNNQSIAGQPVTLLNTRTPVETYGGLIKTPDELLTLIADCQTNENRYHILLQAEWMSHLFYISLPKNKRDDFVEHINDYAPMFLVLNANDENGGSLSAEAVKDRTKLVTAKVKEFESIEENHGKIYYGANVFNQPAFETKLKSLFKLNTGVEEDDTKFNALRNGFLEMAFNTKRKAALRKNDIGKILYS